MQAASVNEKKPQESRASTAATGALSQELKAESVPMSGRIISNQTHLAATTKERIAQAPVDMTEMIRKDIEDATSLPSLFNAKKKAIEERMPHLAKEAALRVLSSLINGDTKFGGPVHPLDLEYIVLDLLDNGYFDQVKEIVHACKVGVEQSKKCSAILSGFLQQVASKAIELRQFQIAADVAQLTSSNEIKDKLEKAGYTGLALKVDKIEDDIEPTTYVSKLTNSQLNKMAEITESSIEKFIKENPSSSSLKKRPEELEQAGFPPFVVRIAEDGVKERLPFWQIAENISKVVVSTCTRTEIKKVVNIALRSKFNSLPSKRINFIEVYIFLSLINAGQFNLAEEVSELANKAKEENKKKLAEVKGMGNVPRFAVHKAFAYIEKGNVYLAYEIALQLISKNKYNSAIEIFEKMIQNGAFSLTLSKELIKTKNRKVIFSVLEQLIKNSKLLNSYDFVNILETLQEIDVSVAERFSTLFQQQELYS